jgi:site-specific DNA-cytosine methylase
VDIARSALHVYEQNFRHPVRAATIESLPFDQWRSWRADLWWLSPPCQPYTVRGRRRDLDDPRAASFHVVVERLQQLSPPYVAVENVPGFHGSRAHDLLARVLDEAGYRVQERLLCPTQLGLPNRRRRFYLLASRDHALPAVAAPQPARSLPLQGFLREPVPDELWVAEDVIQHYRSAMHIVDAEDPSAETHCFTSAYGRSVVRSGSYLRTRAGVRRFSPHEIVRLLGFPEQYQLPEDWPARRLWPLVGNSLSVAAVRYVLRAIPELAGMEA